MKEYYVVGGEQRSGAGRREEWEKHRRGVVLRVHPESGEVQRCAEYESPPEARPSEGQSSILFKTATLEDGRLYTCTQTEVLVYSVPEFEVVEYLSLPFFSDLHHVRPTPRGTLLVVVTGLDLVVEVTLDGELVREWSALAENTWDRFSRDVDYRHVKSTKPHKSHPNHVFYRRGEVWTTRFKQKDAICLTNDERPIDIGVQQPHDGHVIDSRIYFTTVDGQVVIADEDTLQVKEIVDLNQVGGKTSPLGWCRGLCVVDEERVIVGFSRLRPTKITSNILWVKQKMGVEGLLMHPTRIAMYNLKERCLCWEQNLEEARLNVMFSIHERID
jgi:hypothetical protein